MFAVIAAIFFALKVLHISLGGIDLIAIGLLFAAIHLAWGWTPWRRPPV
jgi:hypothetical protein